MSNRKRMHSEHVPAPAQTIALAQTIAEAAATANGKPAPTMTRRWVRALRPRQLVAARIRDHHVQHAWDTDCGPRCLPDDGPGVVRCKP